jgi:hypothetical protein
VYVALSRCRSLNGLVLSSRISHRSIIDNPFITDFINGSVKNQPGQSQLAESKKAYQQQLLSELFDFTTISKRLNYCLKVVNENHGSILGNPRELVEKALTVIRADLIEVSEKFHPQLVQLLERETDAESNIILQERIKKAGEFFSVKLENALKGILTGFSIETDNKTVRKSVTEAFERVRKEGGTKLACLNSVRSGFTIGKYLEAKAKSAIDVPAVKSPSVRSMDDNSGIIQHPVLFNRLKEWRNIKAMESDLPHYMILTQKTLVNIVNFVPQSMQSLKAVKGMGKKKSEKFGEEILEIVVSFCKKEGIEPSEEKQTEKRISKKIKEDTKKISYDLYKEGKSIPLIAEERKLSITTIEGHLSYFVETGEIPVSRFVSQEMADLIMSHFEGTDDLTLGPVKAALGDKVTWSDIRFVVNHLKFLRKSENDYSLNAK